MDLLNNALALAEELVEAIPDPDPMVRRAQYVRRLTALITRLELHDELTRRNTSKLAAARAALAELAHAAGEPTSR